MGERVVTLAPEPPQGRREGPVTLAEVTKLFAWLKSQYGATWTVEPTPENLRAWFEPLRHYTVEDLRRACQALRREGSEYPPSGPKFAKLCKGSIYDQRKRAERWGKQLPPPEKNLELNGRRIAELRQRMKLSRPEDFDRQLERQRQVIESVRRFAEQRGRAQ